VLNTITIQFGPDTMLAAKVRMDPTLNVTDAVASINALERKLKARVPKLKWSFIEPDTAD
jgi:divalent metal cation (Fe/Co/Zn/Cd) transporter